MFFMQHIEINIHTYSQLYLRSLTCFSPLQLSNILKGKICPPLHFLLLGPCVPFWLSMCLSNLQWLSAGQQKTFILTVLYNFQNTFTDTVLFVFLFIISVLWVGKWVQGLSNLSEIRKLRLSRTCMLTDPDFPPVVHSLGCLLLGWALSLLVLLALGLFSIHLF